MLYWAASDWVSSWLMAHQHQYDYFMPLNGDMLVQNVLKAVQEIFNKLRKTDIKSINKFTVGDNNDNSDNKIYDVAEIDVFK